ncbi:penicillin-binding transpeptidase domain-containing protein [Chryseosolibacter indicus]|uniref:beta-lactamase n=1 Tax=Chryseosolibacter indicus TaxID=2782351 RepID=A0ABS5VM52_9BACT|nr:penicillin-binding transpeptidase domain-containing protein [Chryseosolibacter indicus]MBT1702538.1 penicillin binding protein transpeptidase domain-containing protein [Chryseosolibacter indicus]
MKMLVIIFLSLYCLRVQAQVDFAQAFSDCKIPGSITIYHYNSKKWFISDTSDAKMETLPASTFKIINLLIALETGTIKDENAVVKWIGKTDTTLYGYRPDIYRDMTVKEAFELSAGWVFIELAKRIGKEKYLQYLKRSNYGNLNLTEQGADFWNFGAFAISPINQIDFLVRVYKNQLPFSKRNIGILKRVMIAEKANGYTIRAKTGWTRWEGNDIGWWVGYVTNKKDVFFFATRIIKKRSDINPEFGNCRKNITKSVLRQLNAIN